MSIHLTLSINVFKGGSYFSQTVRSVEQVAYLFDEVLISITETECYNEDLVSVEACRIPNLRLLKYPFAGCVNHFKNTIRNLKEGYVVFCGHDDWCIEEGLSEAKNIIDSAPFHPIAMYGSNEWKDEHTNEIQHYCNFDLEKHRVSLEEFVKKRTQTEFILNVAGLVANVNSLKGYLTLMDSNRDGYWVDMLAINTPDVVCVHETSNPMFRVRMHNEQMSRNVFDIPQYYKENIWFHYIQAVYTNDVFFKEICYLEIVRMGDLLTPQSLIKYLIYITNASFKWPNLKITNKFFGLFAINKLILRVVYYELKGKIIVTLGKIKKYLNHE